MKETKAEKDARHDWYRKVLGKSGCWFQTWMPHKCEGPMDPMHMLPKQSLKQQASLRNLSVKERIELVWDTRNGLPGCRTMHSRMDNRGLRVYQHQLPKQVIEFAEENDLVWLLDNRYPKSEVER